MVVQLAICKTEGPEERNSLISPFTATTVIVVTMHIVTIEIVTTRWSYIDKRFCWGNKVIFSVSISPYSTARFLDCTEIKKKFEWKVAFES